MRYLIYFSHIRIIIVNFYTLKQIKKEKDTLEKDEFDMLVDSNVKSLDDRLGNSPEKIEKKTAKKG